MQNQPFPSLSSFNTTSIPSVAITGATGQLGRLLLEQLVIDVPATRVVALARDAAKAAELARHGASVRVASYDDPAALARSLVGVDRLLLISSSELGRRVAQHRNVIDAAKRSGVSLLVYTSLLHADTSPLSLASEHVETERLIRMSGLPFIILRNGWYTENYTVSIPAARANRAFLGSAGNGRISWAARADYAAAAKVALTGGVEPGTYELAGDDAGTLRDLAAEITRQTGEDIPYRDLPEAEFCGALLKGGFPAPLAAGFAAWDVDAAHGALLDESRTLSRLIGRPTTSLAESVRQALTQARFQS